MMYIGIDLHSNNSVVAVIDEGDHVVAQKRLPNDLTKIIGFLARWKDQLAGVVVESTYNWYWLIDGLQEAGFEVHLANTVAIKKIRRAQAQRGRNGCTAFGSSAQTGNPADGNDPAEGTSRCARFVPKANATDSQPDQPYSRRRKYHRKAAWRANDQQSGQAADS